MLNSSSASVEPGSAGVLTAQYEALLQVAATLRTNAKGFESQADETAIAQQDLLAGCGQFAGQVGPAAATFAASWRATFEVCAESERLCAHNTGRMVVDLSATDAAMVIL